MGIDPAKLQFGAVELVCRADHLEVSKKAFDKPHYRDPDFAGPFAEKTLNPAGNGPNGYQAMGYGIGLNWYLNEYFQIQFAWQNTRVDYDRGHNRDPWQNEGWWDMNDRDEDAFWLRFQLKF